MKLKLLKIAWLIAIHILGAVGAFFLTIVFWPGAEETGGLFDKNADKIVYFWADWCVPCKTYGPELEFKAKTHQIELEKIDLSDVDQMKYYDQRYGIKALPTTWYIKEKDTLTQVGGF